MRAAGLAAMFVAALATPAASSSYDDLNVGVAARNRGEFDTAISFFSKALAAGDLNADQQYVANYDRGIAYLALGNAQAAIADFDACVGKRPDDWSAQSYRTGAYLAAGRLDDAWRDAEAIASAHPDMRQPQLVRAEIAEVRSGARSQLPAFEAIVAKFPDFLPARHQLGIAQFLSGELDKASESFGDLLDKPSLKDPIYSPAHYSDDWLWFGMTELKRGKPVSHGVIMIVDLDRWPGPLVQFYRGRMTEDALRAAAIQGNPAQQRAQDCALKFFLGEWRLLHIDRAGGMELLQKAVQDCPKDMDEWFEAQVELKNAP